MFKKALGFLVGAALGVFGLMTSAHAAIDASVSTAFAAVETDAIALSAIVVPIVVSVLGLMLVIKLIKKFGNKI